MTVFAIVLGGLVSFDKRVRDRFVEVVHASDSMAPWSARVSGFGGALMTAVRDQCTDNTPLVVFAAVGGVLFLFMFRT
jgi:hypothetical protein